MTTLIMISDRFVTNFFHLVCHKFSDGNHIRHKNLLTRFLASDVVTDISVTNFRFCDEFYGLVTDSSVTKLKNSCSGSRLFRRCSC